MADLLYLDNRLVIKHFGKRPWLGRRIKGKTMTRYTGVKWQQFGNEFVPAEQTVDLVIALEPVKPGLWRVKVDPRYREFALRWLQDNVGELPVKPLPRHSITVQHKRPVPRERVFVAKSTPLPARHRVKHGNSTHSR